MSAKRFPCGCIEGFYWCAKHDIYTKQDPKDPPPHQVRFVDFGHYEKATGCSCHISAPCSFCTESEPDEDDLPEN